MIVATGPVPIVARELLGEIRVAEPGELEALIKHTEVLIVRGGTRVTGELIRAAPRLRVIGRSGVGYSEVDVAAATARGIPVVLAAGAGSRAVAEGALALVIALLKRLPELDRSVKEQRFAFRDEVLVGDIEDAALGIVGLGRIGRELARLGEAIGMRVLATDPYVPGTHDLREVITDADALSLHAPLTNETRGLINADVLTQAKPGLVLVNLARGGLISSLNDLLAALEHGRLGGVGLDVFEQEPPETSHPIFQHPRVICSPHALWRTPRALEGVFREMSDGIRAALRGERPAAVANPELYR